MEAQKENLCAQLEELTEEHSAEDGYFADFDKVNKASVQKRYKELQGNKKAKEEQEVLERYLKLSEDIGIYNTHLKNTTVELEKKVVAKYPSLTEDEVKTLVVDDKWMSSIEKNITTELERVSQGLTKRIKELAERYETPLSAQTKEVEVLEIQVAKHLEKMGFVWK
jgi:type I restriction enzyme M protein